MFAVDSPPRVTVDSGYADYRQPFHALAQAKVINSINFSSRSALQRWQLAVVNARAVATRCVLLS